MRTTSTWGLALLSVVLLAGTFSAQAVEFTSAGVITLNDGADATPYPSIITVSGATGTVVTVRVKLNGFSHTWPDDMDFFLVAPDGKVSVVMSDAGGSTPATGVNLVFDDDAASSIPDSGGFTSGTYRTFNYEVGEAAPPGATGPIGDSLNALAAGGVNGDWKLYIRDDSGLDVGSLNSWSLELLTGDTLDANYTTGSEIPLTANGFTATGKTVNFTLNHAPKPGTTLSVVKNTANSFIQGTFDNLPNGAAVDLSFGGVTFPFAAWYYGGSGNDLVLLWRDTKLAAWGVNSVDQLGALDNSLPDQVKVPVAVDQTGVLSGKTIAATASGQYHTLALCTDGTLAAWGYNNIGQLGTDNPDVGGIFRAPVVVNRNGVLSGKTIVAIAAGDYHSLALCSDGTIASWGLNINGQLGDRTTEPRASPVTVLNPGASTPFGNVVAIAAGESHSLALLADGTVWAWGAGSSGQLGIGSNATTVAPFAVVTTGILSGKTVVAISGGYAHSLALCSDGTLVAWGLNTYGQLGDNSMNSRNAPVPVNTTSGTSSLFGKTVVAIDGGLYHSLALCSDGTIASWGRNTQGQLGDNSTTNRLAPVPVNTTSALFGRTVTAISAAGYHSLALCSDGSFASWGFNEFGGLGDNTFSQRNAPVTVNEGGLLTSRTGIAPTTGQYYSVVTYAPTAEISVEQPVGNHLTDGSASVSFGTSVPIGAVIERSFTVRNTGAAALTGLSIIIDGAQPDQFSVSVSPTAPLATGGATTFTVRFTPTTAGAKTAVLHLANNDMDEGPFDITLTGTATTAALAATYTTGNEVPLTTYGFTATGNSVSFTLNYAPTQGASLKVVNNTAPSFIQGTFTGLPNGAPVSLTFGSYTYHFIAWYYGGDGNDLVLIWRDTRAAAWGSGIGLGNGSSGSADAPVAVDRRGLLAGKTVIALAAGLQHSLGLCSDGTLAAWGFNGYGQLGNSTVTGNNVASTPVAVDRSGVLAGKTVIALAAGRYHSLALCSDGTVAAWGLNTSGQLGDDSTTQSLVPVLVNTANGTSALFGKTVVAIAAGESHSLALCSDGTVAAWGLNLNGRLGDNSTTQRTSPVLVNTANGTSALFGKTVVAIAAGESHSLALCSDGTIAAWGSNLLGQLGDGSFTQLYTVPRAVDRTGVLSGKTVVAIAAGRYHSMALCSDGTLTAWGYNLNGRLGDNSTTQRNSPVLVNTASGTSALFGKTVVAIAAGREHSQALCSDGTVAAWGLNFYGQLGDSSTTSHSVPVSVTQNGLLAGNRFLGLAASSSWAEHTLALYAAPPEIAVELQPTALSLTSGSSSVSFGTTVLGAPISRSFTLRNLGDGELRLTNIVVDGPNASEFPLTQFPAEILPGQASTTFTIALQPTTAGEKSARIRLHTNDADENPFDINLTGIGIPGAHARLGDTVNLDLSWVPLGPGETFKVIGLPPGLVFTAGSPPTLTGTVLGSAPAGGAVIQIFSGGKVVRTLPLELVAEAYQPASTYELLLEEGGQPTGKLRLTVSNPSKTAPNPAFTATLERPGEPKRSTKGSFTAGASPQTVAVEFPLFKTFPAITFNMVLTNGSHLVTAATSPGSGLTGRGFRLAKPSRIPTGNPALTLTLPPAVNGNGTNTPGGIGHARGTVSSAALVSLAGQLGDAQAFTTALSLSQTNQAVVWLTPYTNKSSYLGGIITLADTGAADRDRSPDTAETGLKWRKVADDKATSYPLGFGPLTLTASSSRWVPSAKADGLAESLGLDFRAIEASYIVEPFDQMPYRFSLRDNFALLRIYPDTAVPFSGKVTATTGSFSGTFTLAAPATKSPVSGVFLQDDTLLPLIGQGLIKIPITGGVAGSFQTAGISFTKPTTLGTHRLEIGQTANIDLSSITLASGETLKVIGLPPGLALTGSAINGTVGGLGGNTGVQIQVWNGKTLVRSLPLDLAVEPHELADSYEVLLEEAGLPVGKLKVTVTSPTKTDTSKAGYSATLERLGEPRRSAKGTFVSSNSLVSVLFPAFQTYPAAAYLIQPYTNSNNVGGYTSPTSSVTGRGFRLARVGHIPTGNPALTMTFPPVVPGDRITTPGGIGWAKGTISTAALVPLSGLLGDAQAFTTSLCLSQTNQAVVWITPYKNKSSYFGGIIDLPAPATPDRGAVFGSITAGLKWARVLDATATSYPNGFSALSLTAKSSRWVPTKTAATLADSLGLGFRGFNASYIAPTAEILPSFWSLRDNLTLLRIAPTNAVPFTGKALGTNGTFTGNLTLPTPAAKSALSGVFFQDAAFGQVIGQGLITVPITAPVKGSFQTFGVELGN